MHLKFVLSIFISFLYLTTLSSKECSPQFDELERLSIELEELIVLGDESGASVICAELVTRLEEGTPSLSSKEQIQVVNNIASAYAKLDKQVAALELTEKYLSLAKSELRESDYELGRLYHIIGSLNTDLGKFQLAETYLVKAKSILVHFEDKSDIMSALAWLYYCIQDYGASVNHYTAAHEAFKENEKSKLKLKKMAGSYLNACSSFLRVRDYASVLKSLQKAESVIIKIDNPAYDLKLNNKFAEYYLNIEFDPQTALEYLQREVKTSENNSPDLSTNYFYTAYANFLSQNYNEAFIYFKKSVELDIEIKKKKGIFKEVDLASNYIWIALTLKELCQYDEAKEYLKDAISFLSKDNQRTVLAEAHLALSDVYYAGSEWSESLASKKEALQIRNIDKQIQMESTLGSTYVYMELFLERNHRPYVDSVLMFMNKTDSLILESRLEYKYFEASESREYIVNLLYAQHLTMLNILSQYYSGDVIQGKIFSYMEGIKAYSTKQDIKMNKGFERYKIPDEKYKIYRDIKNRISESEKLKFSASLDSLAVDSRDSIDHVIERHKKEYHEFMLEIENDFPEFFKYKFSESIVSIQELQSSLKKDEMLVEYFVDTESIFSLAVSRNACSFVSTPKPANWNFLIDDYVKSISDPSYLHEDSLEISFNMYTQSAHQLYEILLQNQLEKVGADIKYISIVPDQELHVIQYDNLLQSEAQQSDTYQNLDYLFQQYYVSNSTSAYNFWENKNRKRKRRTMKYAGFAPSYSIQDSILVDSLDKDRQNATDYYNQLITRDGLADLTFAKESVVRISELLKGKSFLGAAASKSTFLEQLQDASVCHFAGHSIVNHDDPRFSQLVFSGDDLQSQLFATDIYQNQYDLEVIVLSACNTGNGKLKSGDGIQSLSGAFEYSGCKSIIMSLWSVPDFQTSEIDVELFKNIKKGQRIDEALNHSKKIFLENSTIQTSHPFYWSGLTASGKMEPLKRPAIFSIICDIFKNSNH